MCQNKKKSCVYYYCKTECFFRKSFEAVDLASGGSHVQLKYIGHSELLPPINLTVDGKSRALRIAAVENFYNVLGNRKDY